MLIEHRRSMSLVHGPSSVVEWKPWAPTEGFQMSAGEGSDGYRVMIGDEKRVSEAFMGDNAIPRGLFLLISRDNRCENPKVSVLEP